MDFQTKNDQHYLVEVHETAVVVNVFLVIFFTGKDLLECDGRFESLALEPLYHRTLFRQIDYAAQYEPVVGI